MTNKLVKPTTETPAEQQRRLAELIRAGYAREDVQWREWRSGFINLLDRACCPLAAAYAGAQPDQSLGALKYAYQTRDEDPVVFIADKLKLPVELCLELSDSHFRGASTADLIDKLLAGEF